MSRRQVEIVACDGCYLETDGRTDLPEGWTRWEDREICPSCRAAILRFLFAPDRVTACLATLGHGHAGEQALLA